jgi:metallo-beta-lactamase class B
VIAAALLVSGALLAGALPRDSAVREVAPVVDSSRVNDPSWIASQPPFRIYGNTWHVGPRGLGVFLITSTTGHVLIDGGVPGAAPLVEANIRRLGFDPRHVRWLLISHAHCDHAGGIAQLARATGAEVIAGTADVAALASGGRGDPHYGDKLPFPPVPGVRAVSDGETLRLGELQFTAHATPGHTRGNTTWAWTSCEGSRCLRMVDVGSLSAPEYRLLDNPAHPGIVTDYQQSFAKVAALPCDIALAPHPGMVDFWERVARRDAGNADALADGTRCRAYASASRKSFEQELARQRREAGAATPPRSP